ncbi:MAG: GyrI-like domain-containing protein [Anaerolineae bacterium]|nr:GyrI-like domain-containing protein [Anaerolineae bacterium]
MREPRLVDYPPMYVVGLNFYGDPFETSAGWTEENEIGRLWNRFIAFHEKHNSEIANVQHADVMLEIHIWSNNTQITGEFDVFVGVEVTSLEHVPIPLLAKVLPATTYAIFTLQGDEITADWAQSIYQGWMAQHAYRPSHPYMIQWYDLRFRGLDDVASSQLDVYIPVAKQDT